VPQRLIKLIWTINLAKSKHDEILHTYEDP